MKKAQTIDCLGLLYASCWFGNRKGIWTLKVLYQITIQYNKNLYRAQWSTVDYLVESEAAVLLANFT